MTSSIITRESYHETGTMETEEAEETNVGTTNPASSNMRDYLIQTQMNENRYAPV